MPGTRRADERPWLVFGFVDARAELEGALREASEFQPGLVIINREGAVAAVAARGVLDRGRPDVSALLRFEQVVRTIHARGHDIAPTRYGATFPDERSFLAHLRREGDRYARALERVRGCTEFGVRLPFDRARAPDPGAATPATSGTAYLLARKAVHDAVGLAADEARRRLDSLLRVITPHLRASRVELTRARVGEALELSAALLVPRGAADVLRRAFATWPEGQRSALTGPWPPYSFAADDAR